MNPESEQTEQNRPERNRPDADPASNAARSATRPVVVIEKKTVIQRTYNFGLYLALSILTLLYLALIFTQLSPFRRLMASELVDLVESSTNGTLVIHDIQGNLLSGFVLNDVNLKLKTGTKYDSVDFVHVDHILAKYSLIRFLRTNQIGIVSMVLQHPTLHLVKFLGDSTWNSGMLTKPSSNKAKTPFTQIIDLQSFRIQDGQVIVRDYNYAPRVIPVLANGADVKEPDIDWHDLDVRGLELDSRLYVKGAAAQSIRVVHMRLEEHQTGFFIQHLQFSGYLDSIQARMDRASITTGHSTLGFSVELAPPNASLANLEHSSIYLALNGPRVNTTELKQFLPSTLGFLSGTPGIDLVAKGEFGKLHINRLNLDFKNQGNLAITGDLLNLSHSEDLSMNLNLGLHSITNATLEAYVPGLGIPNLSRFGVINIPDLHYVGQPLNFHTTFTAQTTGAGNIAANMALDLRNHGFLYKGTLKAQHLNLAAAIGVPSFESNLNANATLSGSGTNYRTLSSNIVLQTTGPSSFQKYELTTLDLAAQINHGIANFDYLKGALVGGPIVDVRSAMINFVSPQLPYRFNGTIQDFALAQYIPSLKGNPARLDVDADIAGVAKNLEDVTGTIKARLYDLVYQHHHFNDVDVTALLAPTRGGENSLSIQSDIADVSIDHRFKLRDLVSTVPQHVSALVTAITNRYFPTDSTRAPIITQCADSIDFDYYVKLKDLRPLAGFVPKTFLLAEGSLTGSVYGCPNGDISLIMEGDSLGLILRNRLGVSDSLADDSARIVLAPLSDSLAAVRQSDSTLLASVAQDSLLRLDSALKIDSLARLANRQDSIRSADSLLRLAKVAQPINPPPIALNSIAADSAKHALALQSIKVPSIDFAVKRDSVSHSPISLPTFGAGVPRIHVTPSTFRLEAHNLSNDPHRVLEHLDATLDFVADSVIRIGSSLFYHPKLGLAYHNQSLAFDAATVYNDALGFRVKGSATFPQNEFDIALDTLSVGYYNRIPGAALTEYKWTNEGASHIRIGQSGFVAIDTLNLVHPLVAGYNPNNAFSQRLSLGGHLIGDSIAVWAHVPSFDLRDLPRILPMNPKSKTMQLAQFEGTVHQLDLTVDGTLERPEIATKLSIDQLKYSGMTFDSTYIDIGYHNQALRGQVLLHVDTATFASSETQLPFNITLTSANEFRAQIDSIPIIIALKKGPQYVADSIAVQTRPISATVNASHFPIDIATPFIPAFTELHGAGDIHFALSGTRQNIVYGGYATVKDGSFLLGGNNMYYLFDGTVAFKDNALTLQDIAVRNVPADDPYGQALVNGEFDFQGFSIKHFDLKLHTDRLAVLSSASRSTLKTIYGPLSISTGGEDFHFYNTLDQPWIKGHIAITSANLTLPQSASSTQTLNSEGIIYRTIPNDSIKAIDTVAYSLSDTRKHLAHSVNAGSVQMSTIDDSLFSNSMKDIYRNEDGTLADSSEVTTVTGAAASSLQPSFVDKLRMDLQLTIQGDTWVNMPFNGVFGILGAQVDAEIRTDGTVFVTRGDDLRTRVIGDLDLTPNSTFRFYQTFNIVTGRISFHENFNDPELNIVAEYVGPHYGPTAVTDEEIKIQLVLTGTEKAPKINIRIYSRGASGVFDPTPETDAQAQEDAIYYLVSGGYFKRDLDQGGQIQVLSKAASSLSSQVFSTMLGSLLGSTGTASFIRSASLRLGSTVGVQLTAAYHNITFRYNTNSAADALRADYVVDIPFMTIAPYEAARNMLLELQLHTDQNRFTPGSPAEQPLFLARFLYRIPLY